MSPSDTVRLPSRVRYVQQADRPAFRSLPAAVTARGGGLLRVADRLLDGGDVGVLVEEVGDKRAPQVVRREVFQLGLLPSLGQQVTDGLAQGVPGDRVSQPGQDDQGWIAVGH